MSSRLSNDFPSNQYRQSSSSRPISTQAYHDAENPYGAYVDDPKTRHSDFYEPGEPRDEEFDVRADFDGDGPRWSDLYGNGAGTAGSNNPRSYRPVLNPVSPSAYSNTSKPPGPGEELVSVPVLGPEWQKTELLEMSRRGQAGVKSDKRRRAWREWTRDQRGTCGVKWLTRRLLVFVLFFVVVALAITLYFVVPRPPSFTFVNDNPFTVDNSTVEFSRTPTNFSFTGALNLIADTTSSYLPVHFSSLEATLYDYTTNKAIATGDYGNHVVHRGSNESISLPVTFSYSALNASDPTWLDVYNACSFIYTGTTRPELSFRLVLKSYIVGLVTHPEYSTQISGVTCPFERPSNGV